MTSPTTGTFDRDPPASEEFFGLFSCAFDGMAVWEADPWRIRWANPAFWQVLGVAPSRPGMAIGVAQLPEPIAKQLTEMLRAFVESGQEAAALDGLPMHSTHGQPAAIRLCRIGGTDERAVGMIVHLTGDASPASRNSSDASRLDPLTGLPDRASLLKRLATLLQGERACDRQFALLFLDLDNFKHVNDEFGHLVGDQVLREAARRIAECVRQRDMVARYGGDEFIALIDSVTAMDHVQPVIDRIRASLDRPIELAEGEVKLSLSAGVAFATDGCDSPEELLRMADQAMYAAKRSVVESPER